MGINTKSIRRWIRFTIVSCFVVAACLIGNVACSKEIIPPKAEKVKKELTIHGDTRVDQYYWLNERGNSKVIEYLEAENAYTDALMKHTDAFQEKLYDEMVSRIKQTDMSVPYELNGYYYYKRFEEGNEYPFYARKKGSLEADEEIMLDVSAMAQGYDYYHVAGREVSEDNWFLAFGVDTLSRRKYTIHFKDLKTGKILTDAIPNTEGTAVWANDNKTVFYAVKDSTLRPCWIKRHVLGTDTAEDAVVFHETDNTFSVDVFKSKSREYIFIASYHTLSTEYRFLNADLPDGEFQIFQPRERDHEYSIAHFEDIFYIVTNWEAKNFRLMETDIHNTMKEHWREVIPHRREVLLYEIDVFKDFLVLSERKDGLRQIRIISQRNGSDHYIDFDEETFVAYAEDNYEFDADVLRYSYSSLTTPESIYDYNMPTREKTLLKREEVLGGYDPDDYHSERHVTLAEDGAEVPISLVYKKGLTRNSKNPLLLYGYGSYGFSMDPWFRSRRVSLLDRGFVYAIAHVRGGSEMGRYWYEDGKLLKKKNTFTDFIDCAEYLIEEGFTGQEYLFCMGGSAGGLLVGAVVNMRPDLFKGAVAQVPWVDVVTTMLDESIPLTTSEYDEWGNPNEKVYYDYMLSYSPYDNVEAKDYPAMIVTTGLHDSQVQYFEPAKWVAKLRELKTDDNPLLLHIQMEAGHSGKSGRFERYRINALEYAFMLDLLGIKE
jgi:oligopeptidase B